MAGDCTVKGRDIFTELLLVDVVRGHHSTGAALVKRFNDEILMEKAPVPSPMFIATDTYRKFVDTLAVKVMIGHNRYATVGEKSAENAHPFKFDNLVGAHNGTLENWALRQLPDHASFGTDSEALYNSVSKVGIKDTINKLYGAWALTWYDVENGTINLLRNSKRPLFYAYSEDRATIFWASESDMLEWILTRNHVKIFEKSIYSCDPDMHYRWVVPAKIGDKFDKPTLTEVKERTFIQNVRNFSWKEDSEWYGNEYTGNYTNVPPHNPGLPFTPQPKAAQAAKKVDTKKFRPPYKDALGRIITKPKFEELVSGCCVFCDNSNSVWGDFIHPLKDDMDGRKLYLCEDCYNDDDIRALIENAI